MSYNILYRLGNRRHSLAKLLSKNLRFGSIQLVYNMNICIICVRSDPLWSVYWLPAVCRRAVHDNRAAIGGEQAEVPHSQPGEGEGCDGEAVDGQRAHVPVPVRVYW